MKPKPVLDIDALIAEAVPPRPNPQLAFTIPVKLVSEANQSEHWLDKYHRKKQQQKTTAWAWYAAEDVVVKLPCVVRLIRVGQKRLDLDNLAGSFKHVQDTIAKEIGVDDGDERIKWEYEQVAVGKRVYAVRVEVY